MVFSTSIVILRLYKMEITALVTVSICSLLVCFTGYALYIVFGKLSRQLRDALEERAD
jgi:hypothetical protein